LREPNNLPAKIEHQGICTVNGNGQMGHANGKGHFDEHAGLPKVGKHYGHTAFDENANEVH
jgi:hypothetical protein